MSRLLTTDDRVGALANALMEDYICASREHRPWSLDISSRRWLRDIVFLGYYDQALAFLQLAGFRLQHQLYFIGPATPNPERRYGESDQDQCYREELSRTCYRERLELVFVEHDAGTIEPLATPADVLLYLHVHPEVVNEKDNALIYAWCGYYSLARSGAPVDYTLKAALEAPVNVPTGHYAEIAPAYEVLARQVRWDIVEIATRQGHCDTWRYKQLDLDLSRKVLPAPELLPSLISPMQAPAISSTFYPELAVAPSMAQRSLSPTVVAPQLLPQSLIQPVLQLPSTSPRQLPPTSNP